MAGHLPPYHLSRAVDAKSVQYGIWLEDAAQIHHETVSRCIDGAHRPDLQFLNDQSGIPPPPLEIRLVTAACIFVHSKTVTRCGSHCLRPSYSSVVHLGGSLEPNPMLHRLTVGRTVLQSVGVPALPPTLPMRQESCWLGWLGWLGSLVGRPL